MPEVEATVAVRYIVEEWPDIPAGLSAGRLYLHYISAEVTEQLSREMALLVTQLEDA